MSYFSGIYAVYYREMLLYRKKMTRKGHIFAALITPVIYLLAFGFGLGGRVRMSDGSYLDYLLPGLIAMSSMSNSYNWLATGLNLSIRTFRTFQIMLQAPLRPSQIVFGQIAAGMTRGLFSSSLIILVGFFISDHFRPGIVFWIVWIWNTFVFSSLGVIIAFAAKSHEEAGAYSNLIIMPMTFFSGTFFPLDRAPDAVRWFMQLMPLTHTNILIRLRVEDILLPTSIYNMFAIAGFGFLFLFFAVYSVNRYSE